MRVATDERHPARGARAADRPGVAAGRDRAVAQEEPGAVPELVAGPLLPQLVGQRREQQVLGVEDRERRPRLPLPGRDAQLGQLGGVGVQPGVDSLDVRRHEALRLGTEVAERPLGGLGHPGPAGQDVPAEEPGAEDLGGRAGGPAAEVLELPGPVAGGDEPLTAGQVGHRGGPDVRDAVRVAVDPGHKGG